MHRDPITVQGATLKYPIPIIILTTSVQANPVSSELPLNDNKLFSSSCFADNIIAAWYVGCESRWTYKSLPSLTVCGEIQKAKASLDFLKL